MEFPTSCFPLWLKPLLEVPGADTVIQRRGLTLDERLSAKGNIRFPCKDFPILTVRTAHPGEESQSPCGVEVTVRREIKDKGHATADSRTNPRSDLKKSKVTYTNKSSKAKHLVILREK